MTNDFLAQKVVHDKALCRVQFGLETVRTQPVLLPINERNSDIKAPWPFFFMENKKQILKTEKETPWL